MAEDERFADLGRPSRIWAVSAINGAADRLIGLHDALLDRICIGDRMVYLGNYGGPGGSVVDVIDELLAFRRHFISLPGFLPEDVTYLRGAQEEMWQKLLQIQFAPNPGDVLAWMLRQGLETSINAYGESAREGLAATRDSALTMTRWTNKLRAAMRLRGGHEKFMTVLRRAAFTAKDDGNGILFVHSGIDPSRPIGAQKDSFWWDYAGFSRLEKVYDGFTRVIRGSDPEGRGIQIGQMGVTLDDGAGFGGGLIAAQIRADGVITELIQV